MNWKWIEKEWFIFKWMVNWIDSPFFKMNGELNWFTVFWNEWWIEWFTKKWWMDTGLSRLITNLYYNIICNYELLRVSAIQPEDFSQCIALLRRKITTTVCKKITKNVKGLHEVSKAVGKKFPIFVHKSLKLEIWRVSPESLAL